ncbi:MAG: hypothetical protein DSZ29_04200, partial [Aquificaceae bacterium]
MNTKIIIACVSLALMLSACGGGKSSKAEIQSPIANQNTRLQRSISNDTLEKSIKQLMLATYGKIAPPIMMMDSTAESSNADTSKNYSTTNTQETAVDEADRLKNDASYLYVASSKTPSIKVFSTQGGEAVLSSTTTIATDNSQMISGLYLSDNKLITLSGDNSYFWDQWFAPNYWNDRATKLDFFATQNGQLSKINSLKVDGQLISSRRIGNTLYLATRHTPSLKGLIDYPSTEQEVTKNRALIESASLSDFLPNYAINGEDKGDVLSSALANNPGGAHVCVDAYGRLKLCNGGTGSLIQMGICGTSNNQTFSSTPNTNLCSAGTASVVSLITNQASG